jgi:hypothetical protein
MELFRSMVVEQIGDGFGGAIAFGKEGNVLRVKSHVVLQQPRSESLTLA